MHQSFRSLNHLLLTSFLIVLLASCAYTDKRSSGDGIAEDAGSFKYAAWRPESSVEFDAINVLLNEVDELIDNRAYNAAADKLERVLRIKPEYAPAWSRLSWLALQTDSAKRSVQMAKRSNSFAFSNRELQRLNWSFIRDASNALNDQESFFRATQKIESLKAH